jgi:hypothetical protein
LALKKAGRLALATGVTLSGVYLTSHKARPLAPVAHLDRVVEAIDGHVEGLFTTLRSRPDFPFETIDCIHQFSMATTQGIKDGWIEVNDARIVSVWVFTGFASLLTCGLPHFDLIPFLRIFHLREKRARAA